MAVARPSSGAGLWANSENAEVSPWFQESCLGDLKAGRLIGSPPPPFDVTLETCSGRVRCQNRRCPADLGAAVRSGAVCLDPCPVSVLGGSVESGRWSPSLMAHFFLPRSPEAHADDPRHLRKGHFRIASGSCFHGSPRRPVLCMAAGPCVPVRVCLRPARPWLFRVSDSSPPFRAQARAMPCVSSLLPSPRSKRLLPVGPLSEILTLSFFCVPTLLIFFPSTNLAHVNSKYLLNE